MDAVAITSKTQEAADRFYMEYGPCCAGCDWWGHIGSLIGECRKSAPVSGEQRYSMVRMDWNSYRFRDQEAGHILTNREHHCGDFKDGFNWLSLPPAYLRRIGWQARVSPPHPDGAQPPLQSQGREVPTGHSLNSEARPEGALASSGPDEPTPASLLLLLQQAAEALEEAVRAANSYYRDMDADAAYFGRVAAALRQRMGRE